MPKLTIANFRRLPNGKQYGFDLVIEGMITLPRCRIYAGAVQAPYKLVKRNWYPVAFFEPELAREIYEAVKRECPEAQLGSVEETVSCLVGSPFLRSLLNTKAEEEAA